MHSSPEYQPQVTQAFGVPVVTFDVPDAGQINQALRAVILARQEADAGIDRSNVHGWHSTQDLLTWGGEAARKLTSAFGNICAALTEFPSRDGAAPDMSWLVSMWANVSATGASNQLHWHPGAFWSGVYYVDDGGFAQDPEVGGQLVLHSPYEALASMYAPDVAVKLPAGQRLWNTIAVRPRPGRGVLFPSWLMHKVEAYRGTTVRISVALNFSLTLQQRESGAQPRGHGYTIPA